MNFARFGNTFYMIDAGPDNIFDHLPGGTYSVGFDPMKGYYLSPVEDFTLPEKTYGSEIKRYKRIIDTFLSRPAGTGVVLAGEKGSGKTLLSKKVSIELLKMGIPTILVNSQHSGEDFNLFIQKINQPVAIIFDEFEKIYDQDHQKELLTLFDGTMSNKKLFIVTVNDMWKLDEYMVNRPGRFFYMFNYVGISEEAIREYCEENLNEKSNIDQIVNYASMFRAFTFDMLTGIVEEMNRYDESITEVLKFINVNYEFGGGDFYIMVDVKFKDGRKWDKSNNTVYNGNIYNPMKDNNCQIVHLVIEGEDGKTDTDYEYFNFKPNDIVKMNKSGTFLFDNGEVEMTIAKRPPKRMDYFAMDV